MKNGWLYTGDIAVLNKTGFIKIIGRDDELIIKAGMNIYPQEIERVLSSDKRVKEVLVYGFKSDSGVVQIGLKLAGDFLSVSEVKQLCIDRLPVFQIPSRIELVNDLPKNGSGKIIRGGNYV